MTLRALLERVRLGEWHLDVETSGVEFEPRDLWIGVYWTTAEAGIAMDPWARKDRDAWRRISGLIVTRVDVYVCLVPMVPLRLSWVRRRPILEPEVAPPTEILDIGAEYE